MKVQILIRSLAARHFRVEPLAGKKEKQVMRRSWLGIPLAAGLALAVFALTAPVGSARTMVAPSNQTPPQISGKAQVGQVLTTDNGTWSGTAPLTYSYQWRSCNENGGSCQNISGATAGTYTIASADSGNTLRSEVTAKNADGADTSTSVPTAAVATVVTTVAPKNTTSPQITGKAQSGQVLTTDDGAWTGTTPLAYAYQWQACNGNGNSCQDIAGATGHQYTVKSTDPGSTVRVRVTATNSSGSQSSTSIPTAVISKPSSPVNTGLPLISGSLNVGNRLQASSGTWTGLGTSGFAFQWSRCNTNGTGCASISGATGQSYGIGAVDIGNALRVSVTATNSNGATSALSAASVIAAKLNLTAHFNAVLRKNQEVVAPYRTSSRAAGHFTAKLTGKTLLWTLTFTHLSGRPTVAGLNKGLRKASGRAFKTLCRRCQSPGHGTMTLTASQRDALLRGRAYVNIHTARNPYGEIRGQINRVS